MAGNQLAYAVLPDESIGTKYSLDAVFAPDHSIVSIGMLTTASLQSASPAFEPCPPIEAVYRTRESHFNQTGSRKGLPMMLPKGYLMPVGCSLKKLRRKKIPKSYWKLFCPWSQLLTKSNRTNLITFRFRKRLSRLLVLRAA